MSNYAGFDVLIDNNTGLTTPVVSTAVHVYDVTHATALADLATDVGGHVAAGALSVAVGTLIRFWVNLGNGQVAFAEQTTT